MHASCILLSLQQSAGSGIILVHFVHVIQSIRDVSGLFLYN